MPATADDFWLDSAAGAGMSWELGPGAEELVGAHEELGLDLDLGSFLPMNAEAEEALISASSNASDSPAASSMWLSAEQVSPEVFSDSNQSSKASGKRGTSSDKQKRGPRPRRFRKDRCQADGCTNSLRSLSFYYQRNHICMEHIKAEDFNVAATPSRFCQRCGLSHPLGDFDGAKRSCKKALARHNQRRRGQQPQQAKSLSPEPEAPEAPAHPEPALLRGVPFAPPAPEAAPVQAAAADWQAGAEAAGWLPPAEAVQALMDETLMGLPLDLSQLGQQVDLSTLLGHQHVDLGADAALVALLATDPVPVFVGGGTPDPPGGSLRGHGASAAAATLAAAAAAEVAGQQQASVAPAGARDERVCCRSGCRGGCCCRAGAVLLAATDAAAPDRAGLDRRPPAAGAGAAALAAGPAGAGAPAAGAGGYDQPDTAGLITAAHLAAALAAAMQQLAASCGAEARCPAACEHLLVC